MSQQDTRLKIFVPHIHEESALGKVVKDWLEDSFPGRVAVFVSSDGRDNPSGERWLEKIERDSETRKHECRCHWLAHLPSESRGFPLNWKLPGFLGIPYFRCAARVRNRGSY